MRGKYFRCRSQNRCPKNWNSPLISPAFQVDWQGFLGIPSRPRVGSTGAGDSQCRTSAKCEVKVLPNNEAPRLLPLFLSFALHGRRRWVLDLDPVARLDQGQE